MLGVDPAVRLFRTSQDGHWSGYPIASLTFAFCQPFPEHYKGARPFRRTEIPVFGKVSPTKALAAVLGIYSAIPSTCRHLQIACGFAIYFTGFDRPYDNGNEPVGRTITATMTLSRARYCTRGAKAPHPLFFSLAFVDHDWSSKSQQVLLRTSWAAIYGWLSGRASP